VVDFTLKVLLSLAGFFSSNTILPKNRSPFYVFKRVLLSKFRLISLLGIEIYFHLLGIFQLFF